MNVSLKTDWLVNIMKQHVSQETFAGNHVSGRVKLLSYLIPEQIPTLTEDCAMPSM